MGDVLSRDRHEPGPRVRLVAAGAAHVGRGHVSRTLAVAEALSAAGADVQIELIDGELSAIERRRVAAWWPATSGGANGGSPDAVVLDVPEPASFVDRFDPGRLALFDDRDTFGGQAAIVIQPSMPAWTGPGAAGRVLAGYACAPIAGAYRDLRTRADDGSSRTPASPARVIVCFGGSDPADVLGRIGPALAADPGWTAELIVGAGYRGAADEGPTHVLRDPADLPERLAAADLAVIGAGTMKFEVACLGVPAILLAAADDQLKVATAYAATGAALNLGDGRMVDPAIVGAAVADLLADRPRWSAMAAAAHALIDGRGAERIAAAVLDLAAGRRS